MNDEELSTTGDLNALSAVYAICPAPFVELPVDAQIVVDAAQALWNSARVKYPELLPWGPRAECLETVMLLITYQTTKQWSPLPVGTDAAQDVALQSLLCDMANLLLRVSPRIEEFVSRSPRTGWRTGRMQPSHTTREIACAMRMGYAAMWAQAEYRATVPGSSTLPILPYSELPESDKLKWEAIAALVLTLAKIHQMDAVRIALIDHQIDPRFSGPIVADACFGMLTRVT